MSEPRFTEETFSIADMDCPEELALIDKGLRSLDGIDELSPDYLHRSLRVKFDPQVLTAEAIADRLREIGFPAQTRSGQPRTDGQDQPSARLRPSVLLGGLLLAAAAVVHFVWKIEWLTAILATSSAVLSGWRVAWAALRAVRLARLDMNALMIIAAVGALAIGDWFEAATAMFLFGVALWLESFSLGRARQAVRTLVELTPTAAHRIDADGKHLDDVPPEELTRGQFVLVKPGERVPIDGVVAAGDSSVNQAPLTGESMPIEKIAGETVYAGSLNGEGSLQVRVEKTAHDSMLAHVARLVEQAQSKRSPTERFVDRFARIYTPAVITLAVVLATGPPLLMWLGLIGAGQGGAVDWFHRGLVLLVIACPCALVISTPITIVCGLHRATRLGMLVKGGEFLETAGQIDCLAIDKTGTLTVGMPRVVKIEPAGAATEQELLQIAAALESHSEHPLATAIVGEARQRGIDWPSAENFVALRGLGVRGDIDGETFFVASPKFFHQQQLAGGSIDDSTLAGDGTASAALVGTRQRLVGAIYLADQPREDAAQAVAELEQLGIKNIVMLTGDNGAVAGRIAHSVGIHQVHADLLPEDKVKRVEQLAGQYNHLAMVGDGVNDAPALAASKLGIALGSQASDTALETADVVVMSPHLRRLPQLIHLGRLTRSRLTQNIAIALGLKALVLILAALGHATMWMAVAADVGASLLVIFNGMRLLGNREK